MRLAYSILLATTCAFVAAQPEERNSTVKNVTGEGWWGWDDGGWSHHHHGWWGGIDDRHVCTLDASILVVLERHHHHRHHIGASFDGPEVGHHGPPCRGGRHCGNTVRMRCSDVATFDPETCDACCRLASRFFGIRRQDIFGVLIDSNALDFRHHWTGASPNSNRKKRQDDRFFPPPGCTAGAIPCPTTKCMCCAPRRPIWGGWGPPPFPPWHWGPHWGHWGSVGQSPPVAEGPGGPDGPGGQTIL